MASYLLKVFFVCSASSTLLILFYKPSNRIHKQNACKNYQEKPCKTDSLSGILLAVNFNSPHFKNIPLLKKFYGPVFGKLVFCSAQGDKKYDVIGIGGSTKGWLGYNCVTQAMKMYPGYQGYMHTNDDVVINWWNLLDFDQTKIWTSQNFLKLRFEKKHFQEVNKPLLDWWWWKKVNNSNVCGEILSNIKSLTHSDDEEGRIYAILLSNFYMHTKDRKGCFLMWSDVFYIPSRQRENFIKISDIFVKKNVYLEMAVSTILAFLIEREGGTTTDKDWNVLDLNGTYLPDTYGWNKKYRHGIAFYEKYNADLTFIHPIKFGHARMAIANKNIFENVILRYGNLFLKKCV